MIDNVFFSRTSGKIFLNGVEMGRLNYSDRLVFECLITEKGNIVNKDVLLSVGWPGRIVVPNSLSLSIRNIRDALERIGIYNEPETIPKQGYRLSANIICVDGDNDVAIQVNDISVNLDLVNKAFNHNKSKAERPRSNTIQPHFKIVLCSYLYSIYIAVAIGASVIFIFFRILSEPSYQCYEYGSLKLCGSSKIDLKSLPKELLLKNINSTYWFSEHDGETLFIMVE